MSFFKASCRPSTKKGGVDHGKPGYPTNTLQKAGILSRGFLAKSLSSDRHLEVGTL